ncbi:MAG: hypothetical protein IPM80_07275 [Proteobacteria bacterium]|nr:hypothetical protein [Pseudomonadota bacterium]
MIEPARPMLSSRRPVVLGLCGLLLLLGAGLPCASRADTEQMNGNWVLDEERSESYQDAVRVTKEQLMKLRKRHKKQQFSAAGDKGQSSNKYYQQLHNSNQLRAEDTIDVDWSLPGDLETVMEAKTLKIYQARMCAILYDKKFKRLFAINPEGNSYSAKGTEFAHDDLGRTFGYFEGQVLIVDTDIKGGDRLLEKISLDDSANELHIETRYRRSDLARTLTYKRIFRRGE